ncbi:uracil-DNA glycosylase [Magnetospirillum sulfuroxidans]|uniref:Type-4 uracil-DNA glycosylase n=1 Tax=Magnetospirillum sulfuroxidans TaxID=611300 RepID=A0ABS5IFA6_9PROT|nr:uracil-DNA glycosylase [Magnetospirillum sulfuroxidans]MBR9973080.1 uracil-DNA glycosylase [Magnetospirillum sulfuroxidans]
MPLDHSPFDLLRWYMDAGADEAIGEIPVDRFAMAAKPPPQPVRPVAMPATALQQPLPALVPAGRRSAHDGGTAAHEAGQCHDLAQLRQALEAFDALPLKRTAMNTVFADGNPEAEIMCIGEAPGQEEDRQGLPFIGKSGKLLDRMLASIGLDRTNTYITNVVPWRPVDNRKPSPDEIAVCLPFITRHIELVDPKLLILFGGAAASALLARHEGINRLRGRWFDYSSPGLPRPVPAMATFHPAYLLRTPAAKRDAWRDLLTIRKRLDGHS